MKLIKVFLMCISIAFLPSCIASSKHVKQLDKIVEAQSYEIDQIITVLNNKGLLTIDQADAPILSDGIGGTITSARKIITGKHIHYEADIIYPVSGSPANAWIEGVSDNPTNGVAVSVVTNSPILQAYIESGSDKIYLLDATGANITNASLGGYRVTISVDFYKA